MRFRFNFGKRFGHGDLPPEQEEVVGRFERGEITAEEAERLLGGGARAFGFSIPTGEDESREAVPNPPSKPPVESSEDAAARELVERIAREVDEQTGG